MPTHNKTNKEKRAQANPKKINLWGILAFIGLALIILLIAVVIASLFSSHNEYYSSSDTSYSTPSSSQPIEEPKKYELIEYAVGEKTGSGKDATINVERVVIFNEAVDQFVTPEGTLDRSVHPISFGIDSGYQLIQVDITYTNKTQNASNLDNYDFKLESGDGMIVNAKGTVNLEKNKNFFPFDNQLASGATAKGSIFFLIANGAANKLILQYKNTWSELRNSISINLLSA